MFNWKTIVGAAMGIVMATSAIATTNTPRVYNEGWEIGPSAEGYFESHVCDAYVDMGTKSLAIAVIDFNKWGLIFSHPVLRQMYGTQIEGKYPFYLKFSHLKHAFRLHSYLDEGILYVPADMDFVTHAQKAHYVDLYIGNRKLARYNLAGSTFAIGALRMCLSYEKNK